MYDNSKCDKKFCECGCGELIPVINKKGLPARFEFGHHLRGRKVSEQTRRKLRLANIGKKMSEESRRRMSDSRRGKKPNHWKGGRIKTGDGYVKIHSPNHPFCDNHGYVKEHRLAMEKYLGRYLEKWEIVHHINEDRADNRIENLSLMTKPEHQTHHIKKDMSDRLCSKCAKKTLTESNHGRYYEHWYIDKVTKKWLCKLCYMKQKSTEP